MKSLMAFFVGIIFSAGLAIAGMTDPNRIRAFLDVTGAWNPSLALVMAAAAGTYFVGQKIALRMARPAFDRRFYLPTSQALTPALFLGSFLFGVGWALGGFCPGPAIASLLCFSREPWLFLTGMLLGMVLFFLADRRWKIRR